jgi:hypothetical protein
MTAAVPMLEDSLVWQTTGHLAEAAIAALADGEGALLPQRAVHHAATCTACSERVGLAALFALEVALAVVDALGNQALAPDVPPAAQSLVAARRKLGGHRRVRALPSLAPLPVMVPALFVALALVAGAPLLSTLRATSPAHALARLAHVITRAALAARAPGIAELSWLAAALLVVTGVWVARSAVRASSHVSAGSS